MRLDGAGEGFRVVAFHEKPAPALAARIIGRGGLWNSFVMVGRVVRMIEPLHEVRAADVAALAAVPAEPDALAPAYEQLAGWNFSHDFLARIPRHLMVARADDLGWSDWGTPEAIERTLATLRITPPWQTPVAATA
jgi:mannose-1-phosphate guanylyltransferase